MRLVRVLPASQVAVLTPGMCKLEAPYVQVADSGMRVFITHHTCLGVQVASLGGDKG